MVVSRMHLSYVDKDPAHGTYVLIFRAEHETSSSISTPPVGYSDDFWSRDTSNNMGDFLFSAQAVDPVYPYLTVEVGGGMASSYHRRIHIIPAAGACHVARYLAAGASIVGMYMYHGGSDPVLNSTTTQEQQGVGTAGANDMPVISYDFHAPLGEAGQPREHYHLIRRTALLARGWAAWLANTTTFLPSLTPLDATDTKTLRWAVRGDGNGAFIFLSVVQPFVSMEPQVCYRVAVRDD